MAVDSAGNIVSSTNPTGGASAWHVANVEGTAAFVGVSCPSTTLCVAAADRDLVVSRSPAGGASAWTIDHNADTSVGPECGKYGGDSGCYSPLTLLSCPTVSFCRGIDGYAGGVSGDPSTQAWHSGGGGDGEYIEGLACLPDSSCLTLCADGAGYGGYECGGGAGDYYATILCGEGCFELSTGGPIGLWCPSGSTCFASDDSGSLFASNDPTGGGSAWTPVVVGHQDNPGGTTVTGLSCASWSLCAAVTRGGKLLLGPPPPTTQQVKALLTREMMPATPTRALSRLRSRGSYTVRLDAPEPGYLEIDWSAVIAQPKGKPRHVVFAEGGRDLPMVGFYNAVKFKLLLRRRAFQLLGSHSRVQIIATATLTPDAGPTIRATNNFVARS